MVDPTHVAALGPAAAILFGRIVWRARETGDWRATRRELLAETGLSEPMLRTAVTLLRDREWVQTRRTSADDATLVWTPIHAGHADIAESAPPCGGIRTTPPAESAMSSLETGKDNYSPLQSPPEPALAPTVVGEVVTDTPLLSIVPALVESPSPEVDGQPPADDPRWWDFWWEHYPRKVSKKAARTAWDRAIKRDRTHPLVMLRGLADQRAVLIDQHARGFCPHPASWLNGRRWEDTVADISPVDLSRWKGNPFASTAPAAAGRTVFDRAAGAGS